MLRIKLDLYKYSVVPYLSYERDVISSTFKLKFIIEPRTFLEVHTFEQFRTRNPPPKCNKPLNPHSNSLCTCELVISWM